MVQKRKNAKRNNKTRWLQIRVSPKQHQQMQRLAAKRGQSISAMVRSLIDGAVP